MTAGDTTAGSDPTSPTTGDPDTSAGSTAADSGSDSTGAPLGSNGGIQRADPGSDMFAPVYDVPNGNNVFHTYRFSFAVGYP
jgi:hypothetical protein